MWNAFVDLLVSGMSFLSGIFGSNIGLIILFTSLIIRFALLPLTVKSACSNLNRQKKLQSIQPELNQIKVKFKNDPEQLSRRTLDLYKKNDVNLIDKNGLFTAIIQTPLFIGMMSAINRFTSSGGAFLWINDIARPDLFLTGIAAILTLLASLIGPSISEQSKTIIIWMPVILTGIFLWKLSAGIALYWVASNLVSVFQSLIVRQQIKTC